MPEWYFLPYLRDPALDPEQARRRHRHVRLASCLLALVPWLDRSPVKSARFRPVYRYFFWLLLVDCFLLGFCGAHPPEGWYVVASRLGDALLLSALPGDLPAARLVRAAAAPAAQHQRVRAAAGACPGPPHPPAPCRWRKPDAPSASRLADGGADRRALRCRRRRAGRRKRRRRRSCIGPSRASSAPIDRAALARGFQVYKEVCSACHSMNLLHYRNLAGHRLHRGRGQGDRGQRPGDRRARTTTATCSSGRAGPPTPSSRLSPNEKAARAANNGALPPDLSLIVKARKGGADYVHGILTGFGDPPADYQAGRTGMYYNEYFPGHQIAMPPPLSDGAVTYRRRHQGDGRPDGERCRRTSWPGRRSRSWRSAISSASRSILFLIVLTVLLYGAKRKIWAAVH